ncbi:hypothetical protein [Microbulbifer sp. PSTR4-B]|uniref:hypothetical protein n=1 Tax=Microbulbifer sp. PSTR4-B TaxID=3243396 RepID=UPI004038FFE3
MNDYWREARAIVRVWVWSGAVARVLLAAAPVVAVGAFALGGVSVTVEGGIA